MRPRHAAAAMGLDYRTKMLKQQAPSAELAWGPATVRFAEPASALGGPLAGRALNFTGMAGWIQGLAGKCYADSQAFEVTAVRTSLEHSIGQIVSVYLSMSSAPIAWHKRLLWRSVHHLGPEIVATG